jgi:hypothetical protein
VQNGSTRMYLHSAVMCCTNRETRATKKDQDVELAKQFQLLHSPSRLIPKKKKVTAKQFQLLEKKKKVLAKQFQRLHSPSRLIPLACQTRLDSKHVCKCACERFFLNPFFLLEALPPGHQGRSPLDYSYYLLNNVSV